MSEDGEHLMTGTLGTLGPPKEPVDAPGRGSVTELRRAALVALRTANEAQSEVRGAFEVLVADGTGLDRVGEGWESAVTDDDVAIADALSMVDRGLSDLLRMICALEGKDAVAALVAEPFRRTTCGVCGGVDGRHDGDGVAHDALMTDRPLVVANDGSKWVVRTYGTEVQLSLQGRRYPESTLDQVAKRHGELRMYFPPGSPEPGGSVNAVYLESDDRGSAPPIVRIGDGKWSRSGCAWPWADVAILGTVSATVLTAVNHGR